jgi:hypothetical protein
MLCCASNAALPSVMGNICPFGVCDPVCLVGKVEVSRALDRVLRRSDVRFELTSLFVECLI